MSLMIYDDHAEIERTTGIASPNGPNDIPAYLHALNKWDYEHPTAVRFYCHAEIKQEAIQNGVHPEVFALMDGLTDRERLAVFAAYCRQCGRPDAKCQCLERAALRARDDVIAATPASPR
jgi:hypothetical protein